MLPAGTRPVKKQRREELLPHLRAQFAKMSTPPVPPDEDMLYALQPDLRLLYGAASKAAQAKQRHPQAILKFPETLDCSKCRPRIGRYGRLYLDRVDPITLEPLEPGTTLQQQQQQQQVGRGLLLHRNIQCASAVTAEVYRQDC